MTVLTAWDSTTRLIALYAATGCLENEQAQSVLLISPPGQGKSEMIRRFVHLPSVQLLTDMTQFGIRHTLEADQNRQLRHVAITEMDRIFGRDSATRSTTLSLLTNLMTGDVGKEMIGNKEYDLTGRQIGVIAAMTTDQYRFHKGEMTSSGMLSRFQVIATERTDEERRRVVTNMIYGRKLDLTQINWAALYKRAVVTIDHPISVRVHEFIEAHPNFPQGERFVGRFLILLKATAWLNGRTQVTDYDLDVLKLFSPYFTDKRFVQLEWPFHYTRNNRR